ncbi:hypothetical protein COSO111634_31605 [Corallococcus soli]
MRPEAQPVSQTSRSSATARCTLIKSPSRKELHPPGRGRATARTQRIGPPRAPPHGVASARYAAAARIYAEHYLGAVAPAGAWWPPTSVPSAKAGPLSLPAPSTTSGCIDDPCRATPRSRGVLAIWSDCQPPRRAPPGRRGACPVRSSGQSPCRPPPRGCGVCPVRGGHSRRAPPRPPWCPSRAQGWPDPKSRATSDAKRCAGSAYKAGRQCKARYEHRMRRGFSALLGQREEVSKGMNHRQAKKTEHEPVGALESWRLHLSKTFNFGPISVPTDRIWSLESNRAPSAGGGAAQGGGLLLVEAEGIEPSALKSPPDVLIQTATQALSPQRAAARCRWIIASSSSAATPRFTTCTTLW